MKSIKPLLAFFLSFCIQSAGAQQNIAEGYFTSEASTVPLGNSIIVSIKKYNPTSDQIKNAGTYAKNGPLSYLQVPFETMHAALYTKDFQSMLYCLDAMGNVKWTASVGYSKNSLPSPLIESNGFLYTGDCMKDESRVMIQKINKEGQTIWSIKLDSLENVNAIYTFNGRVNALASFDHAEKVEDARGGTFYYKSYPIYFFVQLDEQTGKLIKKEYQMMANYLSSKGFENPVINSDYSYYLNNEDSLIFLTIMNQKGASVVSENSAGSKIVAVAADTTSYHYIQAVKENAKRSLYVISNYYGTNKTKYRAQLPLGNNESNSSRCLLLKTKGDSLLSIINDNMNIYLSFTNYQGRSSLYKKIDNTYQYLPLAANMLNDVPYVITIEGRRKPGAIGRIKILH